MKSHRRTAASIAGSSMRIESPRAQFSPRERSGAALEGESRDTAIAGPRDRLPYFGGAGGAGAAGGAGGATSPLVVRLVNRHPSLVFTRLSLYVPVERMLMGLVLKSTSIK